MAEVLSRIESRHLGQIVHAKKKNARETNKRKKETELYEKGRKRRRQQVENGKKKADRKRVSCESSAGRLGGGKFNFDPVDSAVIPKFNL